MINVRSYLLLTRSFFWSHRLVSCGLALRLWEAVLRKLRGWRFSWKTWRSSVPLLGLAEIATVDESLTSVYLSTKLFAIYSEKKSQTCVICFIHRWSSLVNLNVYINKVFANFIWKSRTYMCNLFHRQIEQSMYTSTKLFARYIQKSSTYMCDLFHPQIEQYCYPQCIHQQNFLRVISKKVARTCVICFIHR